jgi:hypothetical protein
MDDIKIKVRILPLKGIGGVGDAGDVVTMSAADAEMYVRDGFVEVVEESTPSVLRTSPPNSESANLEEKEDHKIIKPQSKRRK